MNIVVARRDGYSSVQKGSDRSKAAGLRYERRVHAALAANPGCLAIYNPRFYYETDGTEFSGHCIPDFILYSLQWLHPSAVVVLECKLTYKPEAAEKLIDIYVPVVQCALASAEVWPVVVAKNLTRDAPEPYFSLKTALLGRLRKDTECLQPPASAPFVPVVQWLGRGEFPIAG